MFDNKLAVFFFLILISSLIASCSTTSNTGTASSDEANGDPSGSKYPAWYQSDRSIQSDDSTYYGYATAIDSDSSASANKAVEQARVELKTAISTRLESIRNDAVVELGSDSGLDSPRFIIALRKVENNIPAVASVEEISVEKNNESSYRSFSKVSVYKEALIEKLDKFFSANANAWNAMKESEAFSQF